MTTSSSIRAKNIYVAAPRRNQHEEWFFMSNAFLLEFEHISTGILEPRVSTTICSCKHIIDVDECMIWTEDQREHVRITI